MKHPAHRRTTRRRHRRQGQGQDRQGPARRPQAATTSTSRASTSSSATSARPPAARTPPVGVIEKEGAIHVSNVAILDPKDKKPTRVGIDAPRGRRAASASPSVPARSSTDMARLKDRYSEEIRPALIAAFGYSLPHAGPAPAQGHPEHGRRRGQAGLEDARGGAEAARHDRRPEAQHPPRASKSVAAFKLREGMPVGLTVTLRDERAYEFLDRLCSIAIPRIRDFRGLNPRSFDGRGNYSMGVREQVIFPEIDYDNDRPGPRSRRHLHHVRRRPTPRRSRCSTPSACRSRATGARRASRASTPSPPPRRS